MSNIKKLIKDTTKKILDISYIDEKKKQELLSKPLSDSRKKMLNSEKKQLQKELEKVENILSRS